ncbi:MAG: hypothetical protein K0M40_18610 [Prolixibacteraceae bacterium]|nr:hypothetical protein [Prolixibacteraceae bacterium]
MKKLFVLGVIYLLCIISVFSQSKKEWERVQSANSWNVYKQFILNYPDSKYTELAKQKLAQLKEPEANKKETEVNQPARSIQKNDPKSQTSKMKPDQNRFKDPIYPDEPTLRSVAINRSGNSLNNIQQNDDQIMLKKKFAYLNGKEINRTELKDLLLSKPESAIEYKKAMNSITTSGVLLVLS